MIRSLILRLAFAGLSLFIILAGLGFIDGPDHRILISAANAAPFTRIPQHIGDFDPQVSLLPPEEYQGDNAAVALFVAPEAIEKLCGTAAGESQEIISCSGIDKNRTPIVILLNPCLMPPDDLYAGLVCHELGHINGWKHADAPRAQTPPPDPDEDAPPANIASLRSH